MSERGSAPAAENKMGTMPVGKLVFNMSLPMMVSMLVQALYNIVPFLNAVDIDPYVMYIIAGYAIVGALFGLFGGSISIGKYLNPIFLICLGILVVAALLDPIQSVGSVAASGAYADNAFSTGFLQGYDTLDALASLAFGIIVVNVIKEMGVEEPGAIAKNTIKSGIFSMVLMTVIYALIAIVGAQSYGLYADQLGEPSFNGGNAFAIVAQHYLGKAGMIVLALTVTFCCMKTAIGLVTACADTFSVMFPRSLSYRSWAIVFTAFSLLVSNIGLSKIISFSAPVLYFLYPLAIMLILLNIFGKYFDYARPVFTWAIGFTMIAAVFDLLKVAGLAQGVVDWVSTWLPFYSLGLGWIVPGAVGTMIGLIIAKPGKKTA